MTYLNSKDSHQQLPMQSDYPTRDEDVDIIDLWINIRRHKKRFLFIFILVFVAGIAISYLTYTLKYSLVSVVQIGMREVDNTFIPIEHPESFLSKIDNSIIPSFTNEWRQKNNYEEAIETKSSSPSNSNIILITNTTNKNNIELLSKFQDGLIQIIVDDHKSTIVSMKSKMESELRMAHVKLDSLNNPLTLENKIKTIQIELDDAEIRLKKLGDERYLGIKKARFRAEILQAEHQKTLLDNLEIGRLEQYKRVEENKKLLQEKINDLRDQIADAKKNLRSAAITATEQTAMTQLLIANEIQQNQNQLAVFEERYHIQLENDKAALMREIEGIRRDKIEAAKKIDLLTDEYKIMLADNKIELERQKLKVDEIKIKLEQIKHNHEISTTTLKEEIREIKARLDNFSETRAVSTAVQSLNPIGVNRLQLIFAAFLIAGFIAFIAMIFSVFGDKVRERLKQDPSI